MDVLRLLRIAALVSVVLVLNTAIVLMVTQARGSVTAQVSPRCVDGDVNGDSGLDIGDPLYLLQHLFQSGPAPVACAELPPALDLELNQRPRFGMVRF